MSEAPLYAGRSTFTGEERGVWVGKAPFPLSSECGTYTTVWPWFQEKVLKAVQVAPSTLGSGLTKKRSGLRGLIASLGGVQREQKMLKGHLPRVIYH